MPMDRGTPDLVRHCVAAVAKQYGGDTQKAFAICVAQLQKNGYLKPGSMELTAAGKAKEKEHEKEPDAAKKLASYEKLLKAARKTEESTADFDRLMNPAHRSGFEDAPRTVARKFERVTANESSMDAMRRLAGLTPMHADRRVGSVAEASSDTAFTKAVKEIAQLTDENHHTEAVQALANLVFPKGNRYRKMMDAAVMLQDAYGSLPPGIDEIRNEVYKQAMKAAQSAGMDVAAIKAAF